MDLRQEEETFDYPLETPDGEKLDVVFTLAGPSHSARIAVEKKAYQQLKRDFNKAGKATLPDDPDDVWDRETVRLVACTLNWVNLMIDGAPVPFSAKAAQELYDNRKFGWVRRRIARMLLEDENFMKSSQAA